MSGDFNFLLNRLLLMLRIIGLGDFGPEPGAIPKASIALQETAVISSNATGLGAFLRQLWLKLP